jgi:hypothetical protein
VKAESEAQKEHLPMVLMVIVAFVLIMIVVSIFILKRDRRKDVDEEISIDQPDMDIPLTARGGMNIGIQSGPLDRSPRPTLDHPAVSGRFEGSPLTPGEETVFRDIESEVLDSEKPRLDGRKKELRKLLEKKRKNMSSEVYDDISRILE